MYGAFVRPGPRGMCCQFMLIFLPLKDKLSSLTALITALADLDSLCETVEGAYAKSLTEDQFERWEEKS